MILEDVVNYLQAQKVGTVGTDIFIDTIPLSSSDAIMLVVESSEDQDAYYDLRSTSVNVYCRNSSDQQGQLKMEAVKQALSRIGNIQLPNNYLCFANTTSVQSHGKDPQNNSLFSMALRLTYYPNTAN